MQAKISAFFKPSTPDDPVDADISNDVIDPEFSAKQEIMVTYKRRVPNSHRTREDGNACELGSMHKEQSTHSNFMPKGREVHSADSGSFVRRASMGRDLNKKRSYAQYYLELGQSDFLLHTCSVCGLKYAPGDEEDEKVHKVYHTNYCHGMPFKGWRNERVVPASTSDADRIILVLDGDPTAHRRKVAEVVKIMESELGLSEEWLLHSSCKVYLFISKQRIIGCLVAEPIENAYQVVLSSVPHKSLGVKSSNLKSNTKSLQFGSVIFHREVVKKLPSTIPDMIEVHNKGVVLCEEEPVPASCGIRAIWVAPSSRTKGIATQLLDALRKSFFDDRVLKPSQCAFSQPTSSGRGLASSFFGTGSFLVYMTGSQ